MRRILLIILVVPTVLGLTAIPARATTLTVTTTADELNTDGDCSLREAITAANGDTSQDACGTGSDPDTIAFNIAGMGQHTVSISGSQLPTITDPVVIDGFSDPDDAGRIELDGTALSGDQGLVLGTGSTGSTVKGLVINDFDEGIFVVDPIIVVEGNYIGTDPTGNAADANGTGIRVAGNTSTIGGTTIAARNVISGNSSDGLVIQGDSNQVRGNHIGVGNDGTTDLGNGLAGVFVSGGDSNTIGGTSAGARNIISGNTSLGVHLGSGSTDNAVQGNYIGLEPDGTTAEPNANGGVSLLVAASNNTIGGSAVGAGNVISSNGGGIALAGAMTSGNVVQGNLIGTTATGNVARPNTLHGIDVAAPSTTIGSVGAGNVISGNGASGINIGGELADNTVIKGNTIGLGLDGSTDVGNSANGIRVFNSALGESTANTTIGGAGAGEGNLISGNGFDGVDIGGLAVDGVTVLGNRIGTDAAGALDRGNDGHGIEADQFATGVTVGGTAAGDGNLVSGNGDTTGTDFGLSLGGGSDARIVQGNRIGTNAAGTGAVPNADGGALVQGVDSLVGGTTGTTPGGNCTGACNLISGNTGAGLLFLVSGGQVQGNFIGVDVTGLLPLGNTSVGITTGTSTMLGENIGGTSPQARNVISGNGSTGINWDDSGASNDLIQGNYIGVGTDGTTAVPNGGFGIRLGGDDVTVGGTSPGAGNVIANNSSDGIVLLSTATDDAIEGNSISANGGLGIDTNDDGVTPNDLGDGDSGPNNLQNFPVLTTAQTPGGPVTIGGTLNSVAATTSRVEFFANDTCDASDHGEGQTFLGFQGVSTDGSGNASFTFTSSGTPAVSVGDIVTATATDPNGSTSEFSECLTVSPAPPGISIGDASVTEGNAGTSTATFTVTRTGDITGTSSVEFATANGSATTPSDYQATSGGVMFEVMETTKTIVVTINGDTNVEPNEAFMVTLSNPSGATIGDGQAIGTIENDDAAPTCPGFESDPRPQLVGTEGADSLIGTSAAEIICGLGGNDTLKGGGAKDLVLGGGGNDRLAGQGGKDVLKGQAGNDKMNGGPGVDRCQGGPGKDSAKACEKGKA